MKKKVSISSGSEPDIQALAKELAGLIDRHDECLRRRDYVGAARMKGMIAEFNKRIKYLEEVSKRSIHTAGPAAGGEGPLQEELHADNTACRPALLCCGGG